MELLINAGLEATWNGGHQCMILPGDADPYIADVESVFTPPGWLTWFEHCPGKYDQPEVRDTWKEGDPRRVHAGDKAMLFFTFFRGHHGGFLQQVQVAPGQKLRLTAYAHAWSNGLEEFHPDAPDWSEGAGYDTIAWKEGSQPHNTGEPQQDAKANFTFRVGIDPTGATNPLADSVVWGTGWHIYNGYCKQLEVETTAISDTVTVFLSSRTLWNFKHNDAYWDDVSLTAISGGECYGKPRTQYKRTYVLIPQGYSDAWCIAAAKGGYASRYTVGCSADDAGIGMLEKKSVLAINPEEWGDLKNFFTTYYPNTKYTPLSVFSPAELGVMLHKPLTGDIKVSQNDPIWKADDLGEAPGGHSIGSAGCLLSSLDMMLRETYKVNITPPILNWLLAREGVAFVSDDTLVWLETIALFNCFDQAIKENSTYTINQLRDLLNDGWLISLRESGPHFTYLEYIDNNGIIHIIDPWDGVRKTRSIWSVTGIRAAHLIDSTPPPPPPPPISELYIGPHLQSMIEGWEDWARETSVAKVLCSQEDVIGIKRVNVDIPVIYRLVDNDYGGILDAEDPHVGARRWIAKFKDSLYKTCTRLENEVPGIKAPYFYVESINEVYPSLNESGVKQAVNFDIAFIEELDKLNLPIKAVVFTAAVGNPHESEYKLLIPLAKKCVEYAALMGYHNYWRGNRNESLLESEWKYYAGRWTEIDKVFVQNGIYVNWYGGESGVYWTAHDGWKSSICYNGNWNRYLPDIELINQKIANWNRKHQNRFLGLVLFTSGIFSGWENFQIRKEQIKDILKIV